MECKICSRTSSKPRFYCSKCVNSRIADHNTLRQQLRLSLAIANTRAASLLSPPAESTLFGVQEERFLKAEKFSLAVRLRDLRVGLEKGKNEMVIERAKVAERRASLVQRRQNLNKASAYVGALSNDSSSEAKDSIQSLTSHLAALTDKHHLLTARTDAARNILIREVLSVYGFSRSERPLPSPFKSASSASSSQSDSSSPSQPSALTYRLAQLPIPSLADLASLPSTHLAASLSHLLHLTRLLALYLALPLPFTPLPSLYGSGRPGVRAAPGWGNSSLPTAYPLFPSRTSSSSKAKRKHRASVFTVAIGGLGGEQSGGREHEGAMREVERQEERMKAVVGGALALAFDLAYIAWSRGREIVEGDVGDLGALLAKAVGIGVSGDQKRVLPLPADVFPLNFDHLLTTQTSPLTLQLLNQVRKSGEGESEEDWDLI